MEKKGVVGTGTATIRSIMQQRNISVSELANLMTQRGLTIEARILSGKLSRDTFSLNEYVIIADILGCDVKTISRDNRFEFTNGYDIEREIKKKENTKKPKKENTKEAEQEN